MFLDLTGALQQPPLAKAHHSHFVDAYRLLLELFLCHEVRGQTNFESLHGDGGGATPHTHLADFYLCIPP